MGEITVKETRDGKWRWHVKVGGESAKGIASSQVMAYELADQAMQRIEKRLRRREREIRKVKRVEVG